MKTAVNQKGETLAADAAAPEIANCPTCGGLVTLRKRRLMGGTATYFWRHRDNRQLACRKRSRPVA